MATLQELNDFANGTVSFTDSRPSDVIFNFPTAVDLTDQPITAQSFTLQRTIDIVEIIQPTQTLITFEVDVSAISGTTVAFGSLPAGVTVTGSGGIFTVSGIDSVSDWEAVRAPTITLPSAEHQGAFQYTCTISYTKNGSRLNKQWSVGTFKTIAELSSTSSLSCTIERPLRGFSAHPIMAVRVTDADFEKIILARFSVDITPTRVFALQSTMPAIATLAQTNQFDNLNNLTYQSNTINTNIFSNVTFNDTRSEFGHRIDFTVSNGLITNPDDPSSDITNSTFIFSSNNSDINDYISQIEYWPDYNYTGEVTLRIQTYYNGITVDDFKTPITHSGAGSITTQTRTFTSNTTFVMPLEEVLYGSVTALVVGGGGGGINQSGGGGGGAIEFTPTFTQTTTSGRTHSIIVGTGGAKRYLSAGSLGVNCSGPFNATDGGQSSAFGAVASGGQGAQYYSCYDGSTTTWDHRGGDSGTSSFGSTTNNANDGFEDFPISGSSGGQLNVSAIGGGGGGSGGDATSEFGLPGPGITSSTFGGTYGPGGYGYGSSPYTGSQSPGYAPTAYGEGGSFGFASSGSSAATNGFNGVVKLKVEPK